MIRVEKVLKMLFLKILQVLTVIKLSMIFFCTFFFDEAAISRLGNASKMWYCVLRFRDVLGVACLFCTLMSGWYDYFH